MRRVAPEAEYQRRAAHYAVAKAVRAGALPRPATQPCAKCGRPAECYHHHKGYEAEFRLVVTPLCNSCHLTDHARERAGPAYQWIVTPAPKARGRIREVLEVRGVYYGWFARQLGVSPRQFTDIEAGRRKAPLGYHERAAALLCLPRELIHPALWTEEIKQRWEVA